MILNAPEPVHVRRFVRLLIHACAPCRVRQARSLAPATVMVVRELVRKSWLARRRERQAKHAMKPEGVAREASLAASSAA
eukprot:101255-Rhodomonas_salina.1